MELVNKKRNNKYDRVMPRVYDRLQPTLNSSSNVTRHRILSSARVGAKLSSTNFNSSVLSDLPTVLNDYETDKSAERTFVVKPRRTIKSLDPAKPPQQAIIKTQRLISKPSYMRAQSSAPSVFNRNSDKWADANLRECYSSRSHSKLKELKHEIQAYHETEKYMKLRSRLYKSCGVVLDDIGQVTVDKGVQADSDPVMVSSEMRRTEWLKAVDRQDLIDMSAPHCRVCEIHFSKESILASTHRKLLKRNAIPDLQLPGKKMENKYIQVAVETAEANTQCNEAVQVYNREQIPLHLSSDSFRKRKLNSLFIECNKKLKTTCKVDTESDMFSDLARIVKEHVKHKLHGSEGRGSLKYNIFCLNLFYAKPQAYELLKDNLCLPSKTTLKHMYLPVTIAIESHLMEILKTKVKHMTDKDRNCALVIDTIGLKANVTYNVNDDKIYGFHDIDGVQTLVPAKYALLAMVHGFFENYEYPVGYALLARLKKFCVSEWIDKLIQKLFTIGLNVRVLISDMGSIFYDSARNRSVSFERPYFFVDDKKIYYIFDSHNLIKLVRDNLMTYDFHFDNHVAKWEHIRQFYEKDKIKQLRLATKLTDSHLKPSNLEKTKLNYAVQILSATVAAGISTYRDFGAIEQSAEGTIKVILMMNDLFDFLNSSSRCGGTKYKNAFCGEEHQICFINSVLDFFAALKIVNPNDDEDATPDVKFIEGFQITLKSILLLFEDFKVEGFTHILTSHVNKGCLENFFSRVRTKKGNSTAPTSWQLVSAFRKTFFINILKSSKEGTCSDDLAKILLESEQLGGILLNTITGDKENAFSSANTALEIVPNHEKSEEGTDKILSISTTDYNRLDLPEKNALIYTSGHLLNKCYAQHKDCDILKHYYIKCEKRAQNFSQDAKYTRYKEYRSDGGESLVIIPQDDFIQFVESMETQFCKYFKTNYILSGQILNGLLKEVQDLSFSMPCPCYPIVYCKKLYFRMRIYYTLKNNNRTFRECRHRRLNFSVANM